MYPQQAQNGRRSHPATAHKGSPTIGNQLSKQVLAPQRTSHAWASCLWRLRWGCMAAALAAAAGLVACQAWWAMRPSHQLIMPPSVLPAVATKMAGQNKSGRSCNRPTTAGSEPMGNKVAEIKAMTNTVLKPNSGRASQCKRVGIQASIRAISVGGHKLGKTACCADEFFTASGCPKNEQLQYPSFTF